MEQACLYFLKEMNAPFVKIGISKDPIWRGKYLFEEIDWDNSVYAIFQNRKIAERTEKFLHAALHRFSSPKGHGEDGWTEWYREEAFALAKSFVDRERQSDFLFCSGFMIPSGISNATYKERNLKKGKKEGKSKPSYSSLDEFEEQDFAWLLQDIRNVFEEGGFLRSHRGSLVMRRLPPEDVQLGFESAAVRIFSYRISEQFSIFWNIRPFNDMYLISFDLRCTNIDGGVINHGELGEEISLDKISLPERGAYFYNECLKQLLVKLMPLDPKEIDEKLFIDINNSIDCWFDLVKQIRFIRPLSI